MSGRHPVPEDVVASCPRPVNRPIMLQGWKDLASVHWRFQPDDVQRLLPPGFAVDTHEGNALVGLIPFHMERIRLPHLPAFGPFSTFPETNVRTYIVDRSGRRGVWFMSLDVTRLIPALVARVSYNLPYCWASMSIEHTGNTVSYRSRRRWPRGEARSVLSVEIGDRIEDDAVSDLEHFVTARWALGSTWAGRPIWADVDHEAWPLHRARIIECDENMLRAAGLPTPAGEPIALWSPGVDVRIGRPRLLRR